MAPPLAVLRLLLGLLLGRGEYSGAPGSRPMREVPSRVDAAVVVGMLRGLERGGRGLPRLPHRSSARRVPQESAPGCGRSSPTSSGTRRRCHGAYRRPGQRGTSPCQR